MGMNNRSGKCPKCRSANVKVSQRMCNHSAFNGYHYTPSDYSEIMCLNCGWRWRTKADYVPGLSDMSAADWKRHETMGLRMELWV